MPLTMYEPTSLAEAASFLQDGANRAAQQNDAIAYGALTSALGIISPALQFAKAAQEQIDTRRAYQENVARIRAAAAELGLGLMCMCPNCEAERAGREEPPCDCEDCQMMRGEIEPDEDDD